MRPGPAPAAGYVSSSLTPPSSAGGLALFLRLHAGALHAAVSKVAQLDGRTDEVSDLAERLASGVGGLRDLADELEGLAGRIARAAARRVGVLVLAGALAFGSGCAAVRDAFVEDRSTWSPQMVADREACDREVIEGRWGWGRTEGDGWTRGFGDALRDCLRSRGWKFGQEVRRGR